MLFSRVDTIFLPVRDLIRAVAWYQELLGWRLAWQNEAAAALVSDGTPITLLQHMFPGYAVAPTGYIFTPVTHVAFNLFAPDIAAAHAALTARGVPVSAIQDRGNLRDFTFTDPDGNLLGVCWWQR